ncbi:MAG TPA: flagellar biosynthetic protein FliO [Pirellulales bacterium]|nr:flagellar biosynthetic protein FliO [Pirellulales bacterium]
MPAKTILFALACLAPLRLAAADGSDDRNGRYRTSAPPQAAASETPPRRFPAGGANALNPHRSTDADVDPASYAAAAAEGVESARQRGAPLNLPPRSDKDLKPGQAGGRRRVVGGASSMMTGAASLAVVLGLFFAVTWVLRRGLPAPPAMLPSEAVEVLGRTPLANRQHAHLLRCGNKLLLVHVSQGAAETLTEITDPLEVDRLTGICRQSHPQSATRTFREALQQFSREKTAGFLDPPASSASRVPKAARSQGGPAAVEDADV